MGLKIQQMHDASLVSIRFDWRDRECVLEFSGAPALLEPFAVLFKNVVELAVTAGFPWGQSVSVLEVTEPEDGRYVFAMQSGDSITLIAPNNSFKPTPLRGAA